MRRRFHSIATLVVVLVLGCAFLQSAFEYTFGNEFIPEVEEELNWPNVDELTGLSPEEMNEIPGFPTTLEQGTFAHLQGAMNATGECSKSFVLEEFGEDDRVDNLVVTVTNCTGTSNCATKCQGYFGMLFEASIDLLLLDDAQSAELTKNLATLTPEAIVQIRMQIMVLELFQVEGTERKVVTGLVEDFGLFLHNQNGDEALVLKHAYLEKIAALGQNEETPQRFDVDGTSDFTKQLKEDVLSGEETQVTVALRMKVPQANLYELRIDGGGIAMKMQPEFILSVVDAVLGGD